MAIGGPPMCCAKKLAALSDPIHDVRKAANVLHHAATRLGAEGSGILFAVEGLYAVHRQLESRYLDLCEEVAYEEKSNEITGLKSLSP